MKNEYWSQFSTPPTSALKTIKTGRLKGMTDISPQWRLLAMTNVFGPVGQGWKYEVIRLWTEPGTEGQVFAFAEVKLYTAKEMVQTSKDPIIETPIWSDPIPGIGGSMLIRKEQNGLHHNDEAYKMALTDALSVAMKQLGVAADIYMGLWDGTKYLEEAPEEPPKETTKLPGGKPTVQTPKAKEEPPTEKAPEGQEYFCPQDFTAWKNEVVVQATSVEDLENWWKAMHEKAKEQLGTGKLALLQKFLVTQKEKIKNAS